MGFKTRPIPDFSTHSGEFLSNDGSQLEWLPGGGSIPGGLAVRAATTAALGNVTYNNGIGGVGATLTKNINQVFPNIDGVVMMLGDRVLLKNQTAQLQNGIYVITDAGSGATPWVLTRTTDSDTTAELDDQVVTPSSGTVNIDQNFGQTTVNPVVGTDPIVYSVGAGGFVRQQTSGTAALGQIPYWINSQRTLSKGNSNFTWLNATGVLSANFSGNGLFKADATAGIFALGFYTGGGNGAALNIVDGSSIDFTADSGRRFLYDMPTKNYYFGDVDAQDNNSFIQVDDINQQFSYKTGGDLYIFSSPQASSIGDINGAVNNTFLIAKDSTMTSGVNIANPTAAWEIYNKQYPALNAPVLVSGSPDDLTNNGIYNSVDPEVFTVTIDGQQIDYSPTAGMFIIGETVTFSGGGTAVIVSDTGTQMVVQTMVAPAPTLGETITGNTSMATGDIPLLGVPIIDTFAISGAIAGFLAQNQPIITAGAPIVITAGLEITFATNIGHDLFAPTVWTMTSNPAIPNLRATNANGTHLWDLLDDGTFTWMSPQGDTFMIGAPSGNLSAGIIWEVGDIDQNYNKTRIAVTDASFKIQFGDPSGANGQISEIKGIFEGDKLHNNAFAQGSSTDQQIRSGTYTPTLTNVTNVSASTAYKSQWMRVGNVVTVSGIVDIDPTAAADTELGISLPVASNLGGTEDLAGTAATRKLTAPVVQILGDITNNRASVKFSATLLSNEPYSYIFTYEVI